MIYLSLIVLYVLCLIALWCLCAMSAKEAREEELAAETVQREHLDYLLMTYPLEERE